MPDGSPTAAMLAHIALLVENGLQLSGDVKLQPDVFGDHFLQHEESPEAIGLADHRAGAPAEILPDEYGVPDHWLKRRFT